MTGFITAVLITAKHGARFTLEQSDSRETPQCYGVSPTVAASKPDVFPYRHTGAGTRVVHGYRPNTTQKHARSPTRLPKHLNPRMHPGAWPAQAIRSCA